MDSDGPETVLANLTHERDFDLGGSRFRKLGATVLVTCREVTHASTALEFCKWLVRAISVPQ